MHMIAYMSTCTGARSDPGRAASAIATAAEITSLKSEISGVIFYEAERFLQVIEGEQPAVNEFCDRMFHDPRHHAPVKLVDEPVDRRSLPGWRMDSFYVENPSILEPKTIQALSDIYRMHFPMEARRFVMFVRRLVDEVDAFKILHGDDNDD